MQHSLFTRFTLLASLAALVAGCGGGGDNPSPAKPTVASLSATSGAVGTDITITGTNFNTTAAQNTVTFGTTAATVTAATATSLTVTVPNGSTKGNVVVKVGNETADNQPEFRTSTFVDTRDGNRSYPVVYVGNQTWLGEHMKYDVASGDACYNDDASLCSTEGRLYDWATAQTACPSGWNLPARTDFETLTTTVGDNATGRTSLLLGGTSGMNMITAGAQLENGNFVGRNSYAVLWTTTTSTANDATIYRLGATTIYPDLDKDVKACVRCLK